MLRYVPKCSVKQVLFMCVILLLLQYYLHQYITQKCLEGPTVGRGQSYSDKVKTVTKCFDRPMEFASKQRGKYWVLYNYVMAEKSFRCHESITYTTHGDYSFLENVFEVVRRWRGPISMALYAPGDDFNSTLEAIRFLRECTDSLVREYVTFHVFFELEHLPKKVPRYPHVLSPGHNCSLPPPFFTVTPDQTYKTQKQLLYPINVARNVAREMSQTHYILPSDIELYPSHNMISQFMQMIAENEGPLLSENPKVFPLHLFEVDIHEEVPSNKTKLLEMLAQGAAVPFHEKICPMCHSLPKAKEWHMAKETKGLNVFNVGKRKGRFRHWEPIFIGTVADPLYDERLTWEGKGDKMTQGYALCVLDYDFLILDNAFLVHKPGIRDMNMDNKRQIVVNNNNEQLKKIIFPQLRVLYGSRKGCRI